jgi:hypothetical protein
MTCHLEGLLWTKAKERQVGAGGALGPWEGRSESENPESPVLLTSHPQGENGSTGAHCQAHSRSAGWACG